MWGNEFGFGSTVYLNEARQYRAATVASIIFSTKKEDGDTQPGSQLGLEGGFGGDFLKGGLTLGLAYLAAFKLSDDEFDDFPGEIIRGKNRVFAVGPEAFAGDDRRIRSMASCVGLLFETYAQTAAQGGALFISGTFLTRPLRFPRPRRQVFDAKIARLWMRAGKIPTR